MSRNEVSTIQTVTVVLIIIAIIVSGVSYSNTTGLKGNISELRGKIEGLDDTLGELASAEFELASAVVDIGKAVGEYGESISAIEERLKEIEKAEPTPIKEEITLIVGTQIPVAGPISPIWGRLGSGPDAISTQVFEGLVQMEPGTTKLVPVLAKNLGETTDAITWTFYLREGIKFHDGTKFDAQAVKFHFDNCMEIKAGTSYLFTDTLLNHTDVIDDYTVRLVLNYPSNVFPKILSTFMAFIESPASVEKYGIEGINDHPIGTGPFKFVSQKLGEGVVLEANQDWWRLNPKIAEDAYVRKDKLDIDRLVFKIIPDPGVLRMALETGVIDVGFREFRPVDYPDLLSNPDLSAYNVEATSPMYYIVFDGNGTVFPTFHSKEMRQALSYAIDYDMIIQAVFGGLAKRLDSFIHPELPEYEAVATYSYNPEKAKELIEEAGFETPVRFEMWIAPDRYGPSMRDIATIIQSSASKAGFDVVIKETDYSTFKSYKRQSVMESMLRFFTMDYPDSDNYAVAFMRSTSGRIEDCEMYLSDLSEVKDKVDSLVFEEQSTPDLTKKTAALKELQEIWAEYLPEIFLLRPKEYFFSQKNVEGMIFAAVNVDEIAWWPTTKTQP